MRYHRATQLDLPGTLGEAARLHEDLTRLRATVETLADDRDRIQAALAQAEAELTRLQAALAHANAALEAAAWREAALLLQRHVPSPGDMVSRDTLDSELRRLITMAHPDKWSQGQPATVLAHDITVALNALRARLNEGVGSWIPT